MKKLPLLALLIVGTLPTAAGAQVYGQFVPADIAPMNVRLGGAYLDISDNLVGLLAQLRQSFYPNVDFGFQGGFSRLESGVGNKTSLRLGTDVRFGVAKASAAMPVDVALGGGLGVNFGDKYHVFRIGPSAVASRTFDFTPSAAVVPYAGMMLLFTSLDTGGASKTDFSVPLRLGAELRPVPGLRISGELQLRIGDDFYDHTAFAAGATFPF